MEPEHLESKKEILEGLEQQKGTLNFCTRTHINLTLDHEPHVLTNMKKHRLGELN